MKYYQLDVRFQRTKLPLGSNPEKVEVTKYYKADKPLNTPEVSRIFYDTHTFSSHPRSYTFTGKDTTEITLVEYDKASPADKLDANL